MGTRHRPWTFRRKFITTLTLVSALGFGGGYSVTAITTSDSSPRVQTSPTPETGIGGVPSAPETKEKKPSVTPEATASGRSAPSEPARAAGSSKKAKPTPDAVKTSRPASTQKPAAPSESSSRKPTTKPTPPSKPKPAKSPSSSATTPKPSASAPATPKPTLQPRINSAEAAVIALTNQARAGVCAPLASNEYLNIYAEGWSAQQAGQGVMQHSQLSFPGAYRAENVAAGSTSASLTFQGWMNSPGHKKNIMNCTYTKMGVGMVNGYWTQVFSS